MSDDVLDLPPGLTARPLALDDLDEAYAVYAEDELEDAGVLAIEKEDIEGDWARPSFTMASDTIGLFDGGRLVGAAEVTREGRSAEGAVLPAARGRGLGSRLCSWAEATAERKGAPVVGQNAPEGSTADRFLAQRGYRLAHTAWVLELPEGRTVPDRGIPAGYAIVTVDGDLLEREAHRVVQSAFGEWEGRQEESFEDWAATTVRRPGTQPWQLRLVVTGPGADEVVGVCFTILDGTGCGYVHQLAVAREHRARGLAQALLADGFRRAREHGAARSELSTDSRTGALDLYRKVGMEVTQTWAHRAIDLPRP